MVSNVKAVSGLYGGFWNFDVQDFCYMTNRYFPPKEFLDSVAGNILTLIGSYPSTNRHLSSILADQLGMRQEEIVVANGASELISAALSLRARHIAIPIPAFDEYRNRALIQGSRVSEYMMDQDFNLNVEGFITHVKATGANSVTP